MEYIIQQIRHQCQANQWFGPPDLKPNRAAWHPPYHPNAHDFVFPPATEEQLSQTEEILGFPIPSGLRSLYLQLANGGFGPGGGVRGVIGGYGKPGTFEALCDETVVKHHRGGYDLCDWASLADHWVPLPDSPSLEFLLPYEIWPGELLPLSDLGCQMEACLHADGHMYLCWASHEPNQAGFSALDMTFERWLSIWLKTGREPTEPL